MAKEYCSKAQIDKLESPVFTPEQINELRRVTPKNEIETKTDENGIKYKSVKGSYVKKKMNLFRKKLIN